MGQNPVSIIERKRDGAELSAGEIRFFVEGLTARTIADYQVSAFAMAVYFRGMSPRETAEFTMAMMESGRTMTPRPGGPLRVDKHSTGGVGDKTSLVLAPLLACLGLHVPMVSGRGLGITGGTLDKLESVPGFRTGLGFDEVDAQLDRIGVAMVGQSDDLCPADRRLYALRDVTGTVPARALIVSSIMSKKLAESLDRLVLDVKVGSGAFMKSLDDARHLDAGLRAVAELAGVEFSSVLTPMVQPLGRAVGNALEVEEAVATLRGEGPADLEHLVLDLGSRLAHRPAAHLGAHLRDGTAWSRFQAMVEAQGGDASSLERLTATVHRARHIVDVKAERSGSVSRVDAGTIGRAAVSLGAGRMKATDSVKPAVGFDAICKVGEAVQVGDVLLRIHADDKESLREAMSLTQHAIDID